MDPLFCLAQAIYFEARSEPIAGQLMVANVIMNRVDSKNYPSDICSVVNQYKQFSYLNDGKPEIVLNKKAWESSIYWAGWYLEHPYKYHESCHYWSDTIKRPYWANGMTGYKIGRHTFEEGGC